MQKIALSLALLACALPVAVDAHKLIEPGPRSGIAKKAFTAIPSVRWNRLDGKEGKFQEIWTIDGDRLNKVVFFGGVPVGQPLFREFHKKRDPLPKVSAGTLITDIPALLEATYLAQRRASAITITRQVPATVDGQPGIRFGYRFVGDIDDVEQRGEAVGAFVKGRLFLVTYEAPQLYFFDKDLPNFDALVQSLKIDLP